MPSRDVGGHAARFDRLVGRSLLLKVVLFVAALVTAVSTLATAVVTIIEWNKSREDWRPAEYAKLGNLRAGQTLEHFRVVLGPPLYRETPRGSEFSYSTFRLKADYWVDVVSNADQVSVAFAVTSCSERFQPAFRNRSVTGPIVLQQTRFTDVPENREAQVKAYGGMTSSSYAFLVLSLGNPSSYRSVAWGVNDTCAALAGRDEEQRLRPWADWSGRNQPRGEINRPWSEFSTSEREYLGRAAVNTYAETSPFTEIAKVYPRQVGVDRIVVRP